MGGRGRLLCCTLFSGGAQQSSCRSMRDRRRSGHALFRAAADSARRLLRASSRADAADGDRAVAIFGEREWSVKLVPIFCWVASSLFLWLLVRDAMGRRAAALATAFFVTLPMELHYGDMVDFEPPILTLMLAALVCLRCWHVRGTNVWIVLAGFCCGGAMWTDWPGYLFVLSISIWLLWRKERNARFFGIALLAIAAASGTLFLLQIRHVNPGSWRDLCTAITMRLGNGVAAGSSHIDPAAELHF